VSIEVDAIVLGEGTEPGTYEVLPGGSALSIAYDAPVQAVSILKEELTVNEKVTIVQNGSGFGVVRKVDGIRGCLSIPESIKTGAMLSSPAMAACSFIGQKAGLTINPYRVGTVRVVGGNNLTVEYAIDSFYSGQIENLFVAPIAGIVAADFAVDDQVLVNAFEYNKPMVVGWWKWEEIVSQYEMELIWGGKGGWSGCPMSVTASGSFKLDILYFKELEAGFTGYSYAIFDLDSGRWVTAFFNFADRFSVYTAGAFLFEIADSGMIPGYFLHYRITGDNEDLGQPMPANPFYDSGWVKWESIEPFSITGCNLIDPINYYRYTLQVRFLKE